MNYIYTLELKTKQYKTVKTINIGNNLGCVAAAYKLMKQMDLSEYINLKVVKVWLMINGERQATYMISEFKK